MGLITDTKTKIKSVLRILAEAPYGMAQFLKRKYLTKRAENAYEVLWASDRESFREVCYFSTYDSDGLVADYVFCWLEAWSQAGVAVVFVSTSRKLGTNSLDRLKTFCQAVIIRPNIGYDFFSWKIGIKLFPPLGLVERVYLMNDSNYGPLTSWPHFLEKIRSKKDEIIGATDSWCFAYHLQSYFICFQGKEKSFNYLKEFLASIEVVTTKAEIIKKYELGLTQRALKKELKCSAVFSELDLPQHSEKILEVQEASNHSRNPTYAHWKSLILDYQSPFLKVALVRENPGDYFKPGSLMELWKSLNDSVAIDCVIEHQKRVSQGNSL